MKVTITCEYCGKTFEGRERDAERLKNSCENHEAYCLKKCASEAHEKHSYHHVERCCANCGHHRQSSMSGEIVCNALLKATNCYLPVEWYGVCDWYVAEEVKE